jgi:hypothetical protein
MIDRAMIDQTCALHTERLSRRASSQIEPHGGKKGDLAAQETEGAGPTVFARRGP